MSASKKKGLSMEAARRAMAELEQRTGKRLTGHNAKYEGATLEQVTLALLRYRPNATEAVKARLPEQVD